jgi:hypothetical protein
MEIYLMSWKRIRVNISSKSFWKNLASLLMLSNGRKLKVKRGLKARNSVINVMALQKERRLIANRLDIELTTETKTLFPYR